MASDLMQQQPPDTSAWPYLVDVAKVVAGLLGGGVLVKLIDKAFGRASERDVLTAGLRTTILDRLTALEKSNLSLGRQIESMRRQNTELQVRLGQAEMREQWLRNRYHRLVNWMQGIEGLPEVPGWVTEDVPRQGGGGEE